MIDPWKITSPWWFGRVIVSFADGTTHMESFVKRWRDSKILDDKRAFELIGRIADPAPLS
jgi:hypothetical protein